MLFHGRPSLRARHFGQQKNLLRAGDGVLGNGGVKPTTASSNLSNANSSECELHHYEYWQHRLYQLQLNDGATEQLLYVDF
jgi:hypothetical protein